ncbi:MAG: ferredoxin family protein [Rhizomicrobium sp.]
MIELIVASRCTGCNACVRVCPTDVFDLSGDGPPRIARPSACQTCFMCELYCDADAVYVGPDCESRGAVGEHAILGALGRYRRDSGWAEWSSDPGYSNEHWRMETVFALARTLESTDTPSR